MTLTRGTYVIMNDIDCPEAMLVAVLTRYDDKAGIWHAVYLAEATNMARPYGRRPTPVAAFGRAVEWNGNVFRVVSTGRPCSATYQDGAPRTWQDYHPGRWWAARPLAIRTCQKLSLAEAAQ